MVEVAKQLHLSQRAQTEHGMIEGCDLLDCDFLARRLVERRAGISVSSKHLSNYASCANSPDYTVGPLSHDILDVVLFRDIEGDLTSALRLSARHVDDSSGTKASTELNKSSRVFCGSSNLQDSKVRLRSRLLAECG